MKESTKCEACENQKVEFSPILHEWVVCCDKRRCKFEPKKNKGLNVAPRRKRCQDQ